MNQDLLNNLKAPFAFLNLNHVEKNISELSSRAGHLKIRLATKSIRCFWVIDYLLKHPSQIFEGVMCFHPDEALVLKSRGIKNILIAYPYVRETSLMNLISEIDEDEDIYFMVDSIEHLEALNRLAKKYEKTLKVSIDIDLSIKMPFLYFGVYRSSLNSLEKVENFYSNLEKFQNIKLKAVMGYEAQFAGLGDSNPFQKILNTPIKLLQKLTWKKVVSRRVEIVKFLESKGITLDFVNGGGTGSLHLTKNDPSVTELAAGSGIYAPGLFDYYSSFSLNPAMGFALEVTRKPADNKFTLAGGGYIASGALSRDKHPKPWNLNEMEMIKDEGFGEVQTPFIAQDITKIGDLKFFRHAKAGELCERFNDIYIIEDNKVHKEKTYRGEGLCFL